MHNLARVLLPIAAFLIFLLKLAHASETKVFHAGGPEQCKLSKAVGGKWVGTDESFEGQPVEVSPVGGKSTRFMQFKAGNNFYAAKAACFHHPGDAGEVDATSMPAGAHKFFVELKGRKYLMMGSGAGGSSQVNATNGYTLTTGPYATSFGFGGRFGYRLNEKHALFLDVSSLSGKQTGTFTGTVTGSSVADESIMSFNVGYLEEFGGTDFKPYAAISAGYSKLTGSSAGTVSVIGNTNFLYESSTVNFVIEFGTTYSLSSMFDLVGSIDYSIMSFSKAKITQTNNATYFPVGQETEGSMGYGHLGFALGVRANF